MSDHADAGQYNGVLLKKPIGHVSKTWQKRFFVIKDGFLLYYEEAEKKVFEKRKYVGLHPKGIMPLGDCAIAATEEAGQPFVISVSNRASEETLFVAAETQAEQHEWIDMLTRSTRITWKNAQLGDAVIQQLQVYGSKLVEERQDIYEKLHMEVRSLSEEKQRTEELERINEELEAERCRMEAMSSELSEEYAKIKDELQTTASALSAIAREKEALSAASQALEQQLQALAQAKEEASRAPPSPLLSSPASGTPCSPGLESSAATAGVACRTDKDSRLRAIEDEMMKVIEEKAEAEQRVREKEELTRLLEEEKFMYSQEATRLRNSLEILEYYGNIITTQAIADEKDSAESELREQIRIRLAAEDRLRAAEQAVHDLAQKLGVSSSMDSPKSPADQPSGSSSGNCIITAEQKEQMRCSVKSLKFYFNHVIAEQTIEASRPIIMKTSVGIRRRGVRAKSMRIAPTYTSLDAAPPGQQPAFRAEPDSTVKLRRAATLLLRDPAIRRTAIGVVTSQDRSLLSVAPSSDCQDSPL